MTPATDEASGDLNGVSTHGSLGSSIGSKTMRWFKHLTDASDDEFIHSLEAEFGLVGYARWWKLCEVIGKKLKPTDTAAAATLPVAVWESNLKAKRKQLVSFLEAIKKQGRINFEVNGELLRIELPKLLKFRDEYRRKSGHAPVETPEKVPYKNTENREQRTDTEKKKTTPSELKRKTRLAEDWQPKASTRTWAAEKFPHVRFDVEFEAWRDWHIGKGTIWLDWDRSLMSWIRKSATNYPAPRLQSSLSNFTPIRKAE